ncbi:DUF3717 domain-containing protein [Ottowia thiooxydans]
MPAIHITDLESAINFWRSRSPSSASMALAPEAAALAEVYALVVFRRQEEIDVEAMPVAAREAWLVWYAATADTPCIAICSTSQGDPICKGCGRTEQEVQEWLGFSPYEKRVVWRRITKAGTALRFNRYAERVRTTSDV